MFRKKRKNPLYLIKNLSSVIGLVLIWRGIWYGLDYIDQWIFGSVHIWSAIVGIGIGLALLYLPEKNFKAIENL